MVPGSVVVLSGGKASFFHDRALMYTFNNLVDYSYDIILTNDVFLFSILLLEIQRLII
jgi:hypothetical protein